ncbi:hypothetical protein [Pseudomonas sp. CFBP 13719]|uniref:hypothetical protein n=1 Tax=Pseudomonas sp. CFBP 13719 TaxID=2775303 RepID=UPI00177B6919|nr:hypothetical protein [Pseudomonas sp. CFBP 13719]MBD8685019.1 hypothetical protein [Pseudomonas sp. CFBP 13719]
MEDLSSVVWRTKVVEAGHGKVKIQMRDGSISDWIGSSLCHRNIGVLIVTLGDLATEDTLLDPLAKSVLQFCRLLVPDDQVRAYKIRSVNELKAIWGKDHANYSHVIFVGHGSKRGLNFAIDGWATPEVLNEAFRKRGAAPKVFISLCCQTGFQAVGGVLSKMPICSQFIAPFHSVHGAIASQFAQTFLAFHLLQGETTGVAFNHARESTPGSTSFRLWRNGRLKAGPAV